MTTPTPSNQPYLSVGPTGYNPYSSGWYLLPVEPAKVVWSAGLSLTPEQVSVLNQHTLQGLIELVYVRIGNDVLFQGLDGLDQALETTTQTLQILSAVQELHNALVTSSLGSFSAWFRFSEGYSSGGRYQSNYNSVASAFFGVPIIPDFIFSSAHATIGEGDDVQTYENFASSLVDIRNQLAAQVQALSELAVGTPDLTDSNSLYNTTKKVLSDLPPIIPGNVPGQDSPDGQPVQIAWSDAKLWAMDFYGAYEGKDLAQKRATDYVVKYWASQVPSPWQGVSISPGRQIGMGTGYRSAANGLIQIGHQADILSIQIVTPGGLMPAQEAQKDQLSAAGHTGTYIRNQLAGTFVLTFSGRIAIAGGGAGGDSGGILPTMIMINPMNSSGEVINAIKGNEIGVSNVAVDAPEIYIGTFGGVTRGQAQNAGEFQQNITLAMTAAQGLNNSQTEQVRGFLFTFEEYYKSASSVLTSLTQLIQKYAQGIRPA